MNIQKISDRVLSLGAADPDLQYFDKLMPTPYGTTYNSYIVRGKEKVALLDPVQANTVHQLLSNLAAAGIDHIDYILILHTEQDHSGSTELLLHRFPEAKLVGSAKVAEFIEIHLNIPASEVQIIAENETLDLGGLGLTCLPIPFAHWPDNTMYWLEEEKILFSSDLYGSHYAALPHKAADEAIQMETTRSYFAEIMMPTRKQVARHVAKTRELDPAVICPAHGPMWFEPDKVLSLYEYFVSDKVQRRVVMPLVSMHDSTKIMAYYLADKLEELEVPVNIHHLDSPNHDLRISMGEVVEDAVDAACLIMAAPTVLTGPHPSAGALALMINAFKPPLKYIGLIGSYGWGSQIEKRVY
ncbi:MAG: FprA family A-type flavoprotein, partial [Eubacteriales bacterium]|nr:FprA family A-type flavoprotein [Eubacteriales bacterium]